MICLMLLSCRLQRIQYLLYLFKLFSTAQTTTYDKLRYFNLLFVVKDCEKKKKTASKFGRFPELYHLLDGISSFHLDRGNSRRMMLIKGL